MNEPIQLEAIGVISSPYKEKFAVPRQANLVRSVRSRLEFFEPFDHKDFIAGTEQFSHFWLIFGFHKNQAAGWKPKVRPPRLGGNDKLGVFSTRSSFRPNGLGLSLFEVSKIDARTNGSTITFVGGDLVDGTPIYDIKPYVEYADYPEQSQCGFAQQAPAANLQVNWTSKACSQAMTLGLESSQIQAVEQVLSQDPRPAYHQQSDKARTYGIHLFDFNIRWQITSDNEKPSCEVLSIENHA